MSLDAWVAINGVKSFDSRRNNVADFVVLAKLKILASANFRQIWVCTNLGQAKIFC